MKKKNRNLEWIEELLPINHIRKPMFGGYGYYIDKLMVLALFESSGDYTYQNKKYNFEIWNGCLFPADKENHSSILKQFPFLINHPILPKWLYLPTQTENFEEYVEEILKQIKRKNKLFGVIPKEKKKKVVKLVNEKIDTRTPRMFSDEPAENYLKTAKKITDLKNLGPSAAEALNKAGIKTVQQFIKLGWKKSLVKLVQSNPKNRHSMFTYALIGALTNKQWSQISEAEKAEARTFTNSLKEKRKKDLS